VIWGSREKVFGPQLRMSLVRCAGCKSGMLMFGFTSDRFQE